MMKNKITATIAFDFKGVHHEPSIEFNLDDWLHTEGGKVPDFLPLIARANHIGTYSYELEIMEVENVIFSNPQGEAVHYFDEANQLFDFDGFYQASMADGVFNELKSIAQTYLREPLVIGSPLHQALQAAFELNA